MYEDKIKSEVMKELRKFKKNVKEAIANYMFSEGCSCCEGSNHDEHKRVIAEMLNVPKYRDGSGYDFSRFCSKEIKELKNVWKIKKG